MEIFEIDGNPKKLINDSAKHSEKRHFSAHTHCEFRDKRFELRFQHTVGTNGDVDGDSGHSIIVSSLSGQPHEIDKQIYVGKLARRSLWDQVRTICSDLFLPVEYPHSVKPGYLRYQFYDSLQGLCSYLRGVVSTSALLKAAGVGRSDATAIGAAVDWALRDGIGMIGGLVFSYVAAPHFDSHVKEFRLFADVINDVGMTLDMLAPLLPPKCVLYVLAASTVCKVACGMSAGATKSSITAHFAIRGNMADLNAKESTQETLVTLVGMSFGILIAKYIHKIEGRDELTAFYIIWVLFTCLTVLHVWSNYEGVKMLHLNTLNRQRAEVALSPVIQAVGSTLLLGKENVAWSGDDVDAILGSILKPADVKESISLSMYTLIFSPSILLGVGAEYFLHEASSDSFASSFATKWALDQNEKYAIGVNTEKSSVCVALRCGATQEDELRSFIHAMTIKWYLDNGETNLSRRKAESLIMSSYLVRNRICDARKEQRLVMSTQLLSSIGWDCGRIYLGFGKHRVEWKSKSD